MRVTPKPSKDHLCYRSFGIAMPKVLEDRVIAVAKRDGVSKTRAARQMIEFALPHFESEVACADHHSK